MKTQDNKRQSKEKPITELQKIILEILLESPNMSMNQDLLIGEALKRQNRIKELSDIK